MDRRWPALAVLCCVEFMLMLDDTVVNVALPTVRAELGFSTAGLAWVVNAYYLAFGGLLLLFGRAADLFGRRSVFLAGVVVFAVASLACGIAQEPWQLVVGRFVQGTGAAMASPAAFAMLTLLFPGARERARVFAIWGGVAALGGTSGLVISGALTGLASWRWIFFLNVPLAVAAVVLIPHLVSESKAARQERLGVPNALLATGAVVSLVYGLLTAAERGWGETTAVTSFALAAGLATAFIVAEARAATPLVPRSLLRDRTRTVALWLSLPFTAAFFAVSFLLMVYLQTVLDFGPLAAGLAFVPYGGGVLLGVAASSRLAVTIGLRWTVVTSLLASVAGLALLTGVSPLASYPLGVLPGMVLAAFGSGIGFPTLAKAAVSGATNDDAGLGSAVLKAAQQVGGAVGLALLLTLVTRGSSDLSDAAFTAGVSRALLTTAVALLVCTLLAAVLLPGRSGRDQHR